MKHEHSELAVTLYAILQGVISLFAWGNDRISLPVFCIAVFIQMIITFAVFKDNLFK